jgi:RimJ/RimL family protein N-acetyltransferase/L-amino acid N-acyltransferase YncA
MNMKTITLRPVDVERDFAQIAALFAFEQDEPTSEPDLRVDYEVHKERIFRLMAAEDEQGELLGFNWATRSRFDASRAYFFVIVKPEQRRQGAGSLLYQDIEWAAQKAGVKHLEIGVSDACPECRAFAEQRGFHEHSHDVGLLLDLDSFDDRPYDEIIDWLKGEGFRFTTMEALGNTPEAQHKLYLLNDSTNMEIIVPQGAHSWLSFEDFQKKVCGADWYKPGGQIIAIDAATGTWAAMSAITRYTGSDHATNLHTGVDRRYQGRMLAQAVLVLALRYARQELNASRVQTDENARNASSLAIYRQLGYTQTPGVFSMEKTLPG